MSLQERKPTVRVNKEDHDKLKYIRYQTDQPFTEILKDCIDEAYQKALKNAEKNKKV